MVRFRAPLQWHSAGIGENSIRDALALSKELEWMGVKIDEEKEQVHSTVKSTCDISAPDSRYVSGFVPTNENFMITLDVQELLGK